MKLKFNHHYFDFINPFSFHRESLKNNVREGVAAEIVIKALDYFLVPFALFLGATDKQIASVVAVPFLASALIILFSYPLVELVGSRLSIVLVCASLQAITLLPLVFIPFLHGSGAISLLIISILCFRALGTVMGASWGSLVSDYLKENERGKFFGCRSHVTGVMGLIITGVFGLWLHLTEKSFPAIAFSTLFAVLLLSRFYSVFFIKKMRDMPIKTSDKQYKIPLTKIFFPILRLFSLSKDKNFFRFLIFVSLTSFATQMSLPFFSVWLRESLGFNFIWYTAIFLASICMGLFFFPLWGRHADIVGNVKVMRQASWLIAIIPLLWIFIRNPVGIIIVEFISGIAWSGFNLSSTNYIYDCCRSNQRVQCLVAFNFITGIFSFLGAFCAGFLLNKLPYFFGFKITALFLVSSILRIIADLVILGSFSEIRKVKAISSRDLFLSVIGLKPLSGTETNWEENY